MHLRKLGLMMVVGSVGAFVCSGCGRFPTRIRIAVPVRACVVQGGSWTDPAVPFGAAGQVSQMMDSVNAIWSQTDVAFVFLPEPRVIADPQPPGTQLLVPPFIAKGQMGDIRLDDERGYGSDEAQAAVDSCNEAWSPGVAAKDQPGFTVVFVRELIWTDGGPVGKGGYSGDLSIAYFGKPAALCSRPYHVSRSDVAGRWSIIKTYDRNYHGSPPFLDVTVAHELGHDLLLGHGDGLDNDQNGVWDEFCDPTEVNSGSSLMDATPGNTKLITPLQAELAKAAALLVPTTKSP